MIKTDVVYKTIVTNEHLKVTIKFNAEDPEKLIGDRSLYGITDKQLIEDIKKKPFVVRRNLHVCIVDLDKKKEYEFVIPRGYTHDGATIPSFAWVLIGQKTEPRFKLASCIHDYLCEHHYLIDSDRRLSTNVFIALCETFGKFNKVKRILMYTSINLFQSLFCGW